MPRLLGPIGCAYTTCDLIEEGEEERKEKEEGKKERSAKRTKDRKKSKQQEDTLNTKIC